MPEFAGLVAEAKCPDRLVVYGKEKVQLIQWLAGPGTRNPAFRSLLRVVAPYDPLPPSVRFGIRNRSLEDRNLSVHPLVKLRSSHQA